MKFNVLVVIILILYWTLFILSCGMFSSNDSSIDCEKQCKKAMECNEGITDQDVQSCIESCKKSAINDYLQDSYVDSVNKCFDYECSEVENCLSKSSEVCKSPDFVPYVYASCTKAIECKRTELKYDECVAQGKNDLNSLINERGFLKCFSNNFFKDFADCIKDIKCESFDQDYDSCLRRFGLEI